MIDLRTNPLEVGATVFVFRHRTEGKLAVEYIDESLQYEDSEDWEHLATLNPRLWIQCHFDEVKE